MNPFMQPKVRSPDLRRACSQMECTVRFANLAGKPCAPQETVVGAHIGHGRAMGTKGSDLFIVAACATCHDIIDGRGDDRRKIAEQEDAWAWYWNGLFRALQTTQSEWVRMGLITGKDWEVIG